MHLATTLRALSGVQSSLLFAAPISLLRHFSPRMVPKPSQTRITGMRISPNVLFSLSSSRSFTESTGSSCITGTRGDRHSGSDLNGNDDEENSGTCGHDDRCEGAEESYDDWYERIEGGVEKELSEAEDELRDAVDYIRREMNSLTEGFAYYSWVDDTDAINPSYWDCPEDMVKPLLKQEDYRRMRSLFLSWNSILRRYGLSDSEYSDLTRGRESRHSEDSFWLANNQVKKRIELWKQERQQK